MNEPRTLNGLLLDYQNMMSNFGLSIYSIKTSRIKELLINEFKDKIGFHKRYQRNQSTIVYDASQGSSFIEAAIYTWGVSDEQLINTVARCLKSQMTSSTQLASSY